ncbi:hypothetical protein [Burkholderia gladioli]|uniref:hypothetical protein n=1 Tax=Burkholderia gladioli TaxID=28095 RepID=UPI001640B55C|nr:hypothetical protein [Burkholderia gladioli]
MNDRKLLELAAKAAGAEWSDYSDRTSNHWHIERADGVWREWNPLTDDGDALRLAVKLRIDIDHLDTGLSAVHRRTRYYPGVVETYGSDECAATRRAITRAAAEIGARITEAGGGS